ncbi:MAG: diguanylate phosphodiesterase [Vibrio sp.]|uniref:diguanylate phosphodiesterase n=1 Tax=Vibrio sp. TaxID=678 RepID=UPI003A897089
MCFVTECYLASKNSRIENVYNLPVKLEKIVGERKEILGYEVLTNTRLLTTEQKEYFYKTEILFPDTTRRIVQKIKNLQERLILFSGLFLFVNVERSHLCDKFLLCDIVSLQQKLKQYDVHLIIEITERNHCCDCISVRDGLQFLRSSNVILAADDVNTSSCDPDFRISEIQSDIYSFIKVNFTDKIENIQYLKSILNNKYYNIIVERIDSDEKMKALHELGVDYWGLQGFLFKD